MKVFIFALLLITAVACTKKNDDSKMFQNLVTAGSIDQTVKITDGETTFEVTPTTQNAESSLLLGYPMGLVGEQSLFGAVVTKVSVGDDEYYGGFKLASFAFPIRTALKHGDNGWTLEVLGCQKKCSETADVKSVFSIPVTEKTADKVVLDLAAFGEKLNIISHIGSFVSEVGTNEWKHVSSRTLTVDFSVATLVFDIESKFLVTLKDKAGAAQKVAQEVTLVSRWYSRLGSGLSPYFEARPVVNEVGFFPTEWEGARKLITRFSIYDLKNNPVKYYLKNIPSRYRAAFAGSFEDWNARLSSTLGSNLLTYEFIEKEDPRFDKLVAGDIRYNVLEWDLDNVAGYGGLGPSTAHPLTGEILSAQTLIQGPTIEKLYKAWFKLEGHTEKSTLAKLQDKSSVVRKVTLDNNIEFTIPAQDPRLHDPIAKNAMDMIAIPQGLTYDAYMDGYFRDMVAHELGHNLGLRHNFKGNLGATDSGNAGSVSRSSMEYLNRGFRHLSRVGEYDIMAIAYGYMGITPEHKDWFCTDEQSDPTDVKGSAECSSDDASSDPFTFFKDRIKLVTNSLLNPNSELAPEFKHADLQGAYPGFVAGLLKYASSAASTASTWKNFFGKEGRPKTADEVPTYVLKELDTLLCSADLETAVAKKTTEEAKALAQKNLEELRAGVKGVMAMFTKPWPMINQDIVKCLPK